METAYDKFQHIPETPCECGTCGLVFRKVPGQRSRRFAKACPVKHESDRQKALHYAREQEKRRKAKVAMQPPRSRVKGRQKAEHNSVEWCRACAGQAWRRPEAGCSLCGLPYAPEVLSEAYHERCRASGAGNRMDE